MYTYGSRTVFTSIGIAPYEMLVAGEITDDGSRILIRRAHNNGAWMFNRSPGEDVEAVLQFQTPCDLPLANESQGEAIAASPDNLGFYTTSEGVAEPIYYYYF